MAFFAVAPSLVSRYAYQASIDDRIDNLWRIHKNRERKGLGGTADGTGCYEENAHTQDRAFRIFNGLHVSMDSVLTGAIEQPMHANPFTRFHQSIEDYPMEMDNMDDYKLF